MTEVEELATFMNRYKDTVAVIEGHSDNTGEANYNKTLSEKRAVEIRKLLIDKFNISKDRLQAVGFGESKPVASNTTKEGRRENRRVVAVVTREQGGFMRWYKQAAVLGRT